MVVAAALLAGLCVAEAAETLRVGGTGSATETLRQLGAVFAARDGGVPVEVIPRLGTSGALRAAADGVLHVVVSGRDLSPEERARGLTEALALRTPFALATSHPKPGSLRSADLPATFAADRPAFLDGAPMRVLLRPRSDSDTLTMGMLFPGMAAALDKARARPDVPVGATDQDNAELAEQVKGSLTGFTLVQLITERRDLRLVPLDGVEPTVEAMESGAYPFAKKLVVVLPARPSPEAERFTAFLRSPEALAILRDAGMVPARGTAAAGAREPRT